METFLLLDNSVVDKTIFLRKKYKLKTPDAILAATAFTSNFILISNNNDLQNIKGLKCLKMF